jgi:hypothetical protein
MTAIAACLIGFALAATVASAAMGAEAARKSPKAAATPSLEKLSCRTGPNDEQARLIVEAVKGRVMEFAFYSRLGTRVCSIHGRRGDAHTKWEDIDTHAGRAVIKLQTGSAHLEYAPGHVLIRFAEVERMPYCGMYGELNGSIEATAKKPECALQGVFDDSPNAVPTAAAK